MKKQERTGFTIVELMISMMMVSIVLSAAVIVMIYGQRSFDREYAKVNLQRDAMYALHRIKQVIRGANQASIEGDGDGVKIYYGSDWTEFKFFPEQKNIRYKTTGDEDYDKILLDGVVENAAFAIDPNTNKTVTVSISLKDGPYEAQVSTSVSMRNFVTGS